MADRPAGEAQRLHDERVGAERETLAAGERAASPRRAATPGHRRRTRRGTRASTSAAEALPPAPWASVTTSSVNRGRRRRNAVMRSRTAASRSDGSGHGVSHRSGSRSRRAWTSDQSRHAQRRLDLLDPVHAVGPHHEAHVEVAGTTHLAAVVPGDTDRVQARARRVRRTRRRGCGSSRWSTGPGRCRRGRRARSAAGRRPGRIRRRCASAVSTAGSSARHCAGSARPHGGRANSDANDMASVALPPLPNVNSRPPPCERDRPSPRAAVEQIRTRRGRTSPRAVPHRSRLRLDRCREVDEQVPGIALVTFDEGIEEVGTLGHVSSL